MPAAANVRSLLMRIILINHTSCGFAATSVA
jgi:hypothetical protein